MKGKVLVTGGAGYIGSVLVPYLVQRGHSVTVLDSLLYGGESLLSCYPDIGFVYGDVRGDASIEMALEGVSAVVHLAALVGEPLCRSIGELSLETNRDAVGWLLSHCADRDIHFILASTCSNYGTVSGFATEDSSLNPLGLYAKAKVDAEELVLNSGDVTPTVLRFATAFGLSPRMRFDTMLNQFARDAALGKPLSVRNVDAWRPFVHVRDIAHAVHLCLEKKDTFANQIVNVGGSNVTKRQLVNCLIWLVPTLQVSYDETASDLRDYRVDFGKLVRLSGFMPQHDIYEGMKEILSAVKSGIFTDPEDNRWANVHSAD